MATEWKQIMPGLKERRLDTGFWQMRIHYSASPAKQGDWADRASIAYGGKDSPRWQREHEINYSAYAGKRLWPMLSRGEHDAQIDISNWTLFRVIDQGIRHPTVCLWVAVNARKDVHVYREFYATNRSIPMNCRAILSRTSENEKIENNYIDPSTARRGAETLKTLSDVYAENGLYCTPADNSFAGYDAVGSAALSTIARNSLRTGIAPPIFNNMDVRQDELLVLARNPALTFDLRYTSRCFEECCNFRWRETKGDETQHAPKEKPVDKEDDGPDCVRYAIQSELYYKAKPKFGLQIINIRQAIEQKKKKEARAQLKRRSFSRKRHRTC
jgi:hypothetical protein